MTISTGQIGAAREIAINPGDKFVFSICTLVTDHAEYREMMDSFTQAGFGTADCEYLYIDNSSQNKADAYAGYNHFLAAAAGKFIILCHQDILLQFHRRADLEARLTELDKCDSNWAVAGNIGGTINGGKIAGRILHSGGVEVSKLPPPAPASSLDENFILVKKKANLALSRDLQGFHFYGTDLCMIARTLGWSAWVIDFKLLHKSEGGFNTAFHQTKRNLAGKYKRAFAGEFVRTTCTEVILGGSARKRFFWRQLERHLDFERIYGARKKFRQGRGPDPKTMPMLPTFSPVWYGAHWLAHIVIRPVENLIDALTRRKT